MPLGRLEILRSGQAPPSEPTTAVATAAAEPAPSVEVDTSKVNADSDSANGTGGLRMSGTSWFKSG